jgi:hypothetical protein
MAPMQLTPSLEQVFSFAGLGCEAATKDYSAPSSYPQEAKDYERIANKQFGLEDMAPRFKEIDELTAACNEHGLEETKLHASLSYFHQSVPHYMEIAKFFCLCAKYLRSTLPTLLAAADGQELCNYYQQNQRWVKPILQMLKLTGDDKEIDICALCMCAEVPNSSGLCCKVNAEVWKRCSFSVLWKSNDQVACPWHSCLFKDVDAREFGCHVRKHHADEYSLAEAEDKELPL